MILYIAMNTTNDARNGTVLTAWPSLGVPEAFAGQPRCWEIGRRLPVIRLPLVRWLGQKSCLRHRSYRNRKAKKYHPSYRKIGSGELKTIWESVRVIKIQFHKPKLWVLGLKGAARALPAKKEMERRVRAALANMIIQIRFLVEAKCV